MLRIPAVDAEQSYMPSATYGLGSYMLRIPTVDAEPS